MDRKPVDRTALSLMVTCCFIWGFNQVAAKLAAPAMTLVMQGGVRSAIAAACLLVWARIRASRCFSAMARSGRALAAGALFAGEFLFIFAGLAYTGAARMVVFIYLAPCLAALGLHWFVPSERLRPQQWAGVLCAFAGITLAFGDGFAVSRGSLLGDAFGVMAAALWAATTVVIRATGLSSASASKTLFYSLRLPP